MKDIQLNKGVRFCYVGDCSIFLSIQDDRYSYAGIEQTNTLRQLSHTFPHRDLPSQRDGKHRELDALIRQNFLVLAPDEGDPLKPTSWPSPIASVYDNYWERAFKLAAIAKLWHHYYTAKIDIKKNTFSEILEKTKKRKSQILPWRNDIDKTVAIDMAHTFIDARSYVYSYFDKCFLDSYVLFKYLASNKVPVDWVFGVDLFPFSAHCWIEYQGVVLNDSLERTLAYQPIHIV